MYNIMYNIYNALYYISLLCARWQKTANVPLSTSFYFYAIDERYKRQTYQ